MTRKLTLSYLPLLLIAITFWLLTQSYFGIRHDGILYAAQAYKKLSPAAFNHDIFFRYGSQDEYSFFGLLYSQLIKLFGLEYAAIFGTLLANILFFISVYSLLSVCLEKKIAALKAASGLFFLDLHYGAMKIFSVSENFFTARSLAEPLVLFSLSAMLSKRYYSAAFLTTLALIFHPLMTLPSILVAFFYFLLSQHTKIKTTSIRVRQAVILLSIALFSTPVILALTGVAPFNKLFSYYDPTWYALVERYNGFVLASFWELKDWSVVLIDVLVIAYYLITQPHSKSLKIFLKSILISCALLFITWIIAGSFLHNVLLTSLQLWRCQWLLHILSICLLTRLILCWPSGSTQYLGFILIALSLAMVKYTAAILLPLVSCVLISNPKTIYSPKTIKYLSISLTTVLIFSLALGWQEKTSALNNLYPDTESHNFLASGMPWGLVLLTVIYLYTHKKLRTYYFVTLSVVGFCVVIALAHWDRRSEWQKNIEKKIASNNATPFNKHLAATDQIYWPEQIMGTWFLLQRANYFHSTQASGALFNRSTAIEFSQREDRLDVLRKQSVICNIYNSLTASEDCNPDEHLLHELCEGKNSPDKLIFQAPIENAPMLDSIDFSLPSRKRTLYLYSCETFK